ncbi:MAG: DUF4830 domain-containing protein [Oscillospiraceae bacterium]|nr:DUF4830 domain-containing protein [Oscillospiraceae bacterium]
MHSDHISLFRKMTAGAALILSLLLCGVAGQFPEGIDAMAPLDGSTPQLRMAYLQELGWQVTKEREDSVLLPAVFDSSYSDYLTIQEQCGFDLRPLAGENVTRYSYDILNYPTGEEGVLLDLLVWNGQIVGGDVRTGDLDGFMKSLKRS